MDARKGDRSAQREEEEKQRKEEQQQQHQQEQLEVEEQELQQQLLQQKQQHLQKLRQRQQQQQLQERQQQQLLQLRQAQQHLSDKPSVSGTVRILETERPSSGITNGQAKETARVKIRWEGGRRVVIEQPAMQSTDDRINPQSAIDATSTEQDRLSLTTESQQVQQVQQQQEQQQQLHHRHKLHSASDSQLLGRIQTSPISVAVNGSSVASGGTEIRWEGGRKIAVRNDRSENIRADPSNAAEQNRQNLTEHGLPASGRGYPRNDHSQYATWNPLNGRAMQQPIADRADGVGATEGLEEGGGDETHSLSVSSSSNKGSSLLSSPSLSQPSSPPSTSATIAEKPTTRVPISLAAISARFLSHSSSLNASTATSLAPSNRRVLYSKPFLPQSRNMGLSTAATGTGVGRGTGGFSPESSRSSTLSPPDSPPSRPRENLVILVLDKMSSDLEPAIITSASPFLPSSQRGENDRASVDGVPAGESHGMAEVSGPDSRPSKKKANEQNQGGQTYAVKSGAKVWVGGRLVAVTPIPAQDTSPIPSQNDARPLPELVETPNEANASVRRAEIVTELVDEVWDREDTPPLSAKEWATYLDKDGRIANPLALRRRIFYGGCEPNIRPEVWKFLLGVSDFSCSTRERREQYADKVREYEKYKAQWQAKRFAKFREQRNRVEKDVVRTDRTQPFFLGDDNPNVAIMRSVLITYAFFEADLGYCQGMSDLLSPILYVMRDEIDAFWCFVALMERMAPNFNRDQSGVNAQLLAVRKLVELLDPPLHAYLRSQDCLNYYFCFRWLLIQFKREFPYETVLRLWEILWTRHLSDHFHLYICVALLKRHSQQIMDEKMEFDSLLRFLNDLSGEIDLDSTLVDAEELRRLAGERGEAMLPSRRRRADEERMADDKGLLP
eukprot:TRINITY_DN15400_c0_g1_i1.p1 TRINITY_DN15400_c0_g1~~TRINITY_DN15400_c0_g1_i1.p1  ORF type:complete len:900 (-),score=212.27 TRINITY_DN15400_c0_g1_i1:760-3459(-)